MSSESKAAVQVYAEQSEGIVAAVGQLLPCAVLAPEATLRRLLIDGVQHSGQVRLLLLLCNMRPANSVNH